MVMKLEYSAKERLACVLCARACKPVCDRPTRRGNHLDTEPLHRSLQGGKASPRGCSKRGGGRCPALLTSSVYSPLAWLPPLQWAAQGQLLKTSMATQQQTDSSRLGQTHHQSRLCSVSIAIHHSPVRTHGSLWFPTV